jgi:hypothetical protein
MITRLILSAFCVALFFSSRAVADATGRIVLRDNVSRAHRDKLVNKFRKITGWTKLTFTADGSLSLESTEIINGSKTARNLVASALTGNNVIVLEDASSRADVAFCRVVPGRWIKGNAAGLAAYVVLIDFADFEQIIGDEQAREAFDVGWGVLHEVDHVITNSADAEVDGHVGECEDHINRMRAELGLPLRASYFFTSSALKTDPNFNKRFVRLPFEQRDTSSRRLKRYWLAWDFNAVGGFVSPLNRLARSSADIF